MNLIVVSGGTGGHIFPAVAVALEARRAGMDVSFWLGGAKLKSSRFEHLLKDASIPLVRVTSGRNPLLIAKGFTQSLWMLPEVIETGRTAVIGAGSYAVVPVLTAALMLAVPIYLLEQNMVPGKVVRFFSRFARCVFSEFPLRNVKFLHTGNPLRPMRIIDKYVARQKLHLPQGKFIVLVVGGSLASEKLARMAVEAAKAMPHVHFVIQTGGRIPHSEMTNVTFKEFIKEMGMYYSAADILLSRAGGGTIAEASIFGIPSILVPYPFASKHHQHRNAEFIEALGGAVVIDEKELTVDKLVAQIEEMMTADLDLMSGNIRKFARPHAAEDVVNAVQRGIRCG